MLREHGEARCVNTLLEQYAWTRQLCKITWQFLRKGSQVTTYISKSYVKSHFKNLIVGMSILNN